ncbi:RibD family protein [Robbsia sp. KACC 23696]|uniref:RibD family protein n=1 Tax=Robbsia sp. KACC 23696 TaxID=3149231 RepID=UPI00325AF053
MQAHIVLHMMTTLDGRIITSHWPKDFDYNSIYEDIHSRLEGDGWIVGRVTMAEFEKGTPKPVSQSEPLPRETWKAPHASNGPYAVAVDRSGKLHLNVDRVNGDAVVVVLTESVPDAHLAELRRDGISYLFAGKTDVDLPEAVAKLHKEFGIKRLLLEGGGAINGAFLDAGLIDEISQLIVPFADGSADTHTLFERKKSTATTFALQTVDRLDHDIVHLRYTKK